MKILISSFGTRGDIQPYLALAVGLQSAGHRVTLATSYNYTKWIQAYGVNTHPTSFSMQEFMQTPKVQTTLKSGNFFQQMRLMREGMHLNAEAQHEVWAAIQEAEFVIQSPTASGALEAANLLGIPVAFASPVPFAPTRAYPSFFLGALRFSLGTGYNYLTHLLMHRALWSIMGAPITNALRKKLDLREWRSYGELLAHSRSLGVPWLYGFSSHVIPKPVDWDELQHITGYWFLDSPADWQPPTDLLRFLESGTPPVYLGFGSMNVGDSEEKTRKIVRALELSGQRGILLTGWGGLTRASAPPNIFFVDDVPHDWLFPRMAVVMHHGGAGSTSAGLRAGVPSIVMPFAGDQNAWAERVAQLGVGSQIKKLTSENLAAAINNAINDPAMRARAAALGEKIRAENGLARAVEIIERHAAGFSRHG